VLQKKNQQNSGLLPSIQIFYSTIRLKEAKPSHAGQ
jgi:hypothetical protein